MRTLLVLLALASLPTLAQNAAPAARVEDEIRALVGDHLAWGPSLNSPGTSLTLAESERTALEVTYHLTATGLPANGLYQLVSFPINSPKPLVLEEGVSLNAHGDAICAGTPGHCSGKAANAPVDIVVRPAKGEPLRIALFAQGKDNLRAFVKTVPLPNSAADASCQVSAVLLTPNSALVLIEGSGFASNTAIQMTTVSEGEQLTTQFNANAAGEFHVPVQPFVKGQDKGVARVTLKSASGCTPSVSFPWGKGVNHPQ